MYKRLAAAFVIIGAAAVGVYFVYFHKPPAKDILAANRKLHSTRELHDHVGRRKSKSLQLKNSDYDDEYYSDENEDGGEDSEDMGTPEGSRRVWDRWIEKNNYVAIGQIFNKCGR